MSSGTIKAEEEIDRVGRGNFEALKASNPALYAAILSFPFDAERDDYCGHCADYLRDHLAACGFANFHHHAHGHSFLADNDIVVDVWPDMDPKVWSKTAPVLEGSVYCSNCDQSACWCNAEEYGPEERIGPVTSGLNLKR